MSLGSSAAFLTRLAGGRWRNALAALGIAISVTAMSVTANLIGSLYLEATSSLRRMGANLIFVVPKDLAQFGRAGRPLNMEDVSALRKLTHVFDSVYPVISVRGSVQACGRTRIVQIIGTLPSASETEQWRLTDGRFIATYDVERRAPVAVTGARLQQDFNCAALGDYISVSNTPFRLIGRVAAQGQRFGINRDDVVLIPMSIAETRYGDRTRSLAIALLRSPHVSSDAASGEIRRVLRRTHRIYSDIDDFDIHTQVQMLEALASVSNATTLIVLVLMGVSLLVAAIGVLNSILVSVAARTGEIGIRRAVGARKVHIVRQFLGEAGGVIVAGTLAGAVCAGATTVALSRLAGLPLWVNGPALALSIVAALVLGIMAGAVPSMMAANLDPVEAMRHE